MERSTVRKLFLAAFLALPLQYALVGLGSVLGVGEPWPAVVLPGFQAVWDDASTISVPRADFQIHFNDGSTATTSPADVFASVPASHHLGIMRRQFMPADLSGSKNSERGTRDASRSWLRQRFETLFDGRSPGYVEVVWQEVRYKTRGRAEAVPLDTLRIHLIP